METKREKRKESKRKRGESVRERERQKREKRLGEKELLVVQLLLKHCKNNEQKVIKKTITGNRNKRKKKEVEIQRKKRKTTHPARKTFMSLVRLRSPFATQSAYICTNNLYFFYLFFFSNRLIGFFIFPV